MFFTQNYPFDTIASDFHCVLLVLTLLTFNVKGKLFPVYVTSLLDSTRTQRGCGLSVTWTPPLPVRTTTSHQTGTLDV